MPILAPGPTLTSFDPFTDNFAVWKSIPSICGPRTYSIIEAYTWASLISPAAGLEFTNPWTLSIDTLDLTDVGTHTLTI